MSYVETYYSRMDFGNYSLLNNYIYVKQNDLVGKPANYYINSDNDKKNINYSSITMDYDDNGIKNGTDHNVYTPEEVMIILNSVPKLSEVPDNRIFLSTSTVNFVEFIIPCNGILRYNISHYFTDQDVLTKNGIKLEVITNRSSADDEYSIYGLSRSFPINVNKNDVIKCVRNTIGNRLCCSFYFLPYVYPGE